MVTIIARIRVLPGSEKVFEEVFRRRRQRCLATEPQTLRYDLFREPAEPAVFTVIEVFTSAAGEQAHLDNSTDHVEMMVCFDGTPEVHRLEDCFGDSSRPAG
jgi:quinol monooxygenase YgiN